MKTVAIIAEYNPFHTGHEYQINKIREDFGQDTRIIAIMSGNYTQRGSIAIADKSVRAECAVRCGVNLVLELPFPFSCSSAEFFARSGVYIASRLGVVDILSFGSELGDINKIKQIAINMQSKLYLEKLSDLINSESHKNIGFPALCEKAYKLSFNEEINSDYFTPNNILAIEYIKAILNFSASIDVHTVKRFGADYSENKISDTGHQSATAIRRLMLSDFDSAIKYIPINAQNTIIFAYKNKQMPCIDDKLSSAIISHFRLNSPTVKIHDAEGGLYNRLQNASFEASTISNLTEIADTKKYTSARIRRAIWYSFFGVTSSEVKKLPNYTLVLAMDGVGKSILKDVKKKTDFPIVTKPSSYGFLSDTAKMQKELSDKADTVFQLTKPESAHGKLSLKTSPFILK
jgi:predicted nucleotidyltransferase